MIVSLTDINAKLKSIRTRNYPYSNRFRENIQLFGNFNLTIHTITPLLLPPSTLREMLENIKRGFAQHSHSALPNDPK